MNSPVRRASPAPQGDESPADSLAGGGSSAGSGAAVGPVLRAHLVLVGLPGAGKSTLGPLLSQAFRCDFLDFDQEIERREGRTIVEIFSGRGEGYFRGLERQLTAQVRLRDPMILAPGGGWMTDTANVALIRPPARIIHLRVSIDTAVARLGTQLATRPLLKGTNPAERLARLWEERAPMYAAADAEVDTELLTPQGVTSIIRALVARWGWPVA